MYHFKNILRLPKAEVIRRLRLGHMRMLGTEMLVQRSAESAVYEYGCKWGRNIRHRHWAVSLEEAMSAVYTRGFSSAPLFFTSLF